MTLLRDLHRSGGTISWDLNPRLSSQYIQPSYSHALRLQEAPSRPGPYPTSEEASRANVTHVYVLHPALIRLMVCGICI